MLLGQRVSNKKGKRQRSSQLDDKLSSYQKFFRANPKRGLPEGLRQAYPSFRPNVSGNYFLLPETGVPGNQAASIRKRSGLEGPSRGPELPDTAQGAPRRKRGTRYPFLTRPRNGSKKSERSKSFCQAFDHEFPFLKLASLSRKLPEFGRGNGLAGSS